MGDLRLDGRTAVLADLGRYLQVPFDSLVNCVGAVPSQRNNTSRPDAYLVRDDKQTAPRTHWFDIAVPFEFKKERNTETLRDDEQKIIWSLHNIMREDPCRRFAFGFTIEDTNHAFVAATKPINFFENIDDVISLFYALGSASASATMKGLGWDPTVERVHNGEEIQYKFTVGDEVFTMTHELATYGADSMVGRGTRVYEATDTKGKKVAIKDSWREVDRQSEGEILENILASCAEKLQAEELADAKRHFVGVQLWNDVIIDDTRDETLDPMVTEEHDRTWEWVSININLNPILSVTYPTLVDCLRFFPHNWTLLGDMRLASHAEFTSTLSLKMLESLSRTSLLWPTTLSGGLKGKTTILTLLTSIVHATLSPILFAQNSNTSHDVRTGTMPFMALEVESQKYYFLPPLDPLPFDTDLPIAPPFCMNFLHNIEFVWWAFTWIFFYHMDTNTAKAPADHSFDVYSQWTQFQLAFPGTIGQSSCWNFFTLIRHLQSSCKDVLSKTCFDVCHHIPHFAKALQDGYRKAEANYPLLALDNTLLGDMHRRAAKFLCDAQECAMDIKLSPLPDLLKQKRPRPEDETSPPPKKKPRHD
ncbi:hypothetical protein EV702DRAFT_1270925 [Suillus placidus]|uniref:Fungal-type protein kinase domain-containing protein n=1 Tax=Suillus placidus TaxID=48579 RepID=A0A9P6ZLG9_9AGAM|nr:hypothetical protein EV702DRAFT_1270925 [Suillus placidus]